MRNAAEEPVIGEKMGIGKAVARTEMTCDLQIDIDIDAVLFKLVDKIIPAVELSGIQMLRIIGIIFWIPDPLRSGVVVHVMKPYNIDTKLGEAGGYFLRPVLGGEVGAEGEIHSPKFRPASGLAEIEMAVGSGADMTPDVNDRRRILPGIIKKQMRGIDNSRRRIVPGQDKGKPL